MADSDGACLWEIIGGQTATGEMLPISEAFKRGGDAGVVMGHITGRASTNVLLAPTNTLPQGFTPGDVITGFHEVVSTQAKLRSTLQTLEQLHRQNRIAITAGSIGPCTGKSQWNRTNTSGGVHAPRTEPGEDFRCRALRADLVPIMPITSNNTTTRRSGSSSGSVRQP